MTSRSDHRTGDLRPHPVGWPVRVLYEGNLLEASIVYSSFIHRINGLSAIPSNFFSGFTNMVQRRVAGRDYLIFFFIIVYLSFITNHDKMSSHHTMQEYATAACERLNAAFACRVNGMQLFLLVQLMLAFFHLVVGHLDLHALASWSSSSSLMAVGSTDLWVCSI